MESNAVSIKDKDATDTIISWRISFSLSNKQKLINKNQIIIITNSFILLTDVVSMLIYSTWCVSVLLYCILDVKNI